MRRIALILCAFVLGGAVLLAQGPVTPSAAVTSTVYDGTTPLLPKCTLIDEAQSGHNFLVGAVTDKKVRVLSAFLTMTGTAVTVRFTSGMGSNAEPLTGQMTPSQGQTIAIPFSPIGWFETSTNTLLSLQLGGAQSVDGAVCWVEVP